MRHTFRMLGGALAAALLSAPTQAQTAAEARGEPSQAAADVISIRGCRPPADAKEAQVLTFEPWSLQARLAVSLGKDAFKVVTVKLWDRPDDPRPVIPVIEAARITEGQLQFYTPDLHADPQPLHDRNYVIVAALGGAQICWANPGSLVKEGARAAGRDVKPEAAQAKEAGRAAGRAARPKAVQAQAAPAPRTTGRIGAF